MILAKNLVVAGRQEGKPCRDIQAESAAGVHHPSGMKGERRENADRFRQRVDPIDELLFQLRTPIGERLRQTRL